MRPILTLLFLALCLTGPLVAADKKLVLETPEILAPFAPLVMARFSQAGIDAEVRFVPFVRLQQDLLAGNVDGAFFVGESFLQETTVYDEVPVPLYRNEYLMVTLADGPVIRGPQDLKGMTVAYPRGYTGVAPAVEGAKVTTVVDEDQGFRMLGAQRVQVVIASRTSTQIFGSSAGKPLRILEPPLVTGLLYLVLHQSLAKENAALTALFRRSVADGSWDREVTQVVQKQTRLR